ncbi:hypothetical protein [Streptomyces sp. t39]|uniref:hypothetical protein n=1 Tax=Streptomyces sp. t39 TaxID=1828156 RepID=UPI0011CD5A0A|nr:hypothetical protein [Streptomyces sp. t39]TXS50141.1 hypothetical protein EAO77_27925 [Streptomyces sp. t39]
MRLQRAYEHLLDTLTKTPGVHAAVPWDRTEHTRGVHVTLDHGHQLWIGITVAAAPGDKGTGPDIPVTGEPPAPLPSPEPDTRPLTPATAQTFLTAALANTGNAETDTVYGYTPAATRPGVGIRFHSGARAFCLIHRHRTP